MPKAVDDSTGYVRLLSSIRREMARGIVEARRAVKRQKVLTYWTIGEFIRRYVSNHVAPGNITWFYGHLSADLNINSRTLQHCEQFFRTFPGLKPRVNSGVPGIRIQTTLDRYGHLLPLKNYMGVGKRLDEKIFTTKEGEIGNLSNNY